MRKLFIAAGIGILAVLFVFWDLGFFYPDGAPLSFRGTGSRYSASLIRKMKCEIFYPDKDYRPIGSDGWSTEAIHGYWCMNDKDIEEFKKTI